MSLSPPDDAPESATLYRFTAHQSETGARAEAYFLHTGDLSPVDPFQIAIAENAKGHVSGIYGPFKYRHGENMAQNQWAALHSVKWQAVKQDNVPARIVSHKALHELAGHNQHREWAMAVLREGQKLNTRTGVLDADYIRLQSGPWGKYTIYLLIALFTTIFLIGIYNAIT